MHLAFDLIGVLERALEGQQKMRWESIVNACYQYYGDHEPNWPKDLEKDLVPKYLPAFPETNLQTYGHPASATVEHYPFLLGTGMIDANKLRDNGHWLYDSVTKRLIIDCTHKDACGVPFSTRGGIVYSSDFGEVYDHNF